MTLCVCIALIVLVPSVSHALTWVSWDNPNTYIDPDIIEPGGEITVQFSFILKGEVGAYSNWWRVNLDGSTTSPLPTSGTMLAEGTYNYTGVPQPTETTITISTTVVIPEDIDIGEHVIQIWVSEGPGWNYLTHLYSPDQVVLEVVPSVLPVDIDIRPCVYPNYIVLNPWSLVPVAILSDEDFDATAVDPATVDLAGAGVAYLGCLDLYIAIEMDVNCDGLNDLVCGIEVGDIDPDQVVDGYAYLVGSTYDGQDIEGSDEVILKVPRWWRW
jgi:hypothetical protein